MKIPAQSIQKKKEYKAWYLQDLDFSFSGKKLNDKRRQNFYEQLSILLNSGLDIKSSTELLVKEKNTPDFLAGLNTFLTSGSLFSESMSKIGQFSKFELSTVQIGEETGQLNRVIEELAQYYKDKNDIRSVVVNLLIYPVLVFLLTLGVSYFMLLEVVPMFQQIFASFDSDLPRITQWIVNLSEFMSSNRTILLLSPLIIFGVFITIKKQPYTKIISSKLLMSAPLIGPFVRKVIISRMATSLSLLLSSDVPLERSLGLINQMISFHPLNVALKNIRTSITKGDSFYSSVSQFPKIFDPRITTLIKVGEESGNLPSVFQKLSEQYRKEIRYRSEVLGKIAEPVLILFVAIFVGFILVAMYMPLFSLGNTIG